MLRTTLASSRVLRVCVLGLATFTAATIITSDSAEARRYGPRREAARESYSPLYASIIVDGNSGAVLSSSNPDSSRHPASLTKIMTLYLLFERLEAGKMKLDTEMEVSQHASEQAPTKLGLRPGQTLKVEDAIKGLVTRSANDAAAVIAEAIAGDEADFAKLMTRKARALGMTKTVYRNASGLPDSDQVTTARDQATLGRAIQERFPRYYRYFATTVFNYRGQSIRNHNRLLGNVEGVDGIKTGYTRASGFNLVSSMRRGNRHLIGVVLGGRSGGSRDAIMRNLLAENLDRAATTHTVAAIAERNLPGSDAEVASVQPASRPVEVAQVNTSPAATEPALPAAPARPSAKASLMAAAAAALPPAPARLEQQAGKSESKSEPAPLTNGVIQTQPISAIPGSAEPMKPVRVRTVQVKAGQIKLAAAGPAQPIPSVTNTLPAQTDAAETSGALKAMAEAPKTEMVRTEIVKREIAKVETTRAEVTKVTRADMPPQPANFGTGNGVLGVLPASSTPAAASSSQTLAAVDPTPRAQPQTAIKSSAPANHTGWIVQVGALESENEARERIDLARTQSRGLLSKADPFTEPVVARDSRKLFRARFAGLQRDEAEAVCRTLKRADISCITVRD